jgi:hypothetical protein
LRWQSEFRLWNSASIWTVLTTSARVLGEDDPEPPRSIIGAIVRTGVLLAGESRECG